MLDRGAAVGGSSIERAREGLAFAKLLRDAGAAYFTGNPAAREMLTTMERMGLPYVVHEYLHAHWVPMYFTQLATEMADKRFLLRRPAPALSQLSRPRDPRRRSRACSRTSAIESRSRA